MEAKGLGSDLLNGRGVMEDGWGVGGIARK